MIARRNQNSGAHNCRRGTRLPLRNGQSRALREHVRDRRSKVHCLSGAQTNNHFLRASTSSMGGHCAPRHLSQYLRAFTGCSAEFPHAVCTAAPASSRAIRPKLSSLFKCSSVYARPSFFQTSRAVSPPPACALQRAHAHHPVVAGRSLRTTASTAWPVGATEIAAAQVHEWADDPALGPRFVPPCRRGLRCSPIPSHVRHLADALTSCIASCQPSRALHAKRPRNPRETVHRRANGAHNDHAPGTAGLSLQRKARPFFRSPPTLGWSLDRAAPRSCNEEVLGYRANMFNNECVIWEHQGWRISTRNRAPAGRCAGPHVVAQKPARAARERAKLRSRQTT